MSSHCEVQDASRPVVNFGVNVKASATGLFAAKSYHECPMQKVEHPISWVLCWLRHDGSEESYVPYRDELQWHNGRAFDLIPRPIRSNPPKTPRRA